MKALITVCLGTEKIAQEEINEIIQRKAEIKRGTLLFDFESFDELAKLSYLGQSFLRVIVLLKEFNTAEQDPVKIVENIKEVDLSLAKKFVEEVAFAARVSRGGTQEYSKQDLEKEMGAIIHNSYANVDLNNPNITFFMNIQDNNYYFGIDFSGSLESKEYRVYTLSRELKPQIAYSLLKFAGYKRAENKTILDPFCGSGVIGIETAFYLSKQSAWFFKKDSFTFSNFKIDFDFSKIDEESEENKKRLEKNKLIMCSDALLHNIKSSEKNARIAGINKIIKFSKIDIDWIDTKHKKESIDFVCTHPSDPSKNNDEKIVRKIQKESFYQLEFVLKKKAKLAFVTKNPGFLIESSENYKFKQFKTQEVMQGKEKLTFLLFEKV